MKRHYLGLTAVASLLMGNTALATDVFHMPAGQTSLVMVPVGDSGNAADTTGYGSVSYAYNIGKYDVTAGQYTAFLISVAATDTYGLYNLSMLNSSFGCGITQSSSHGVCTYSVDPAFVNRPVTNVSFWDTCRFANWLNNGQPIGAEGVGTTETGAYTLTLTGIANNAITRNTGATWAVPTENEWYKAAYYNPATSSYYLYPTSSNTAPGNNLADLSGNNANYWSPAVTCPIEPPYYTTVVGLFKNSASPYGTFDQGGDVWQWNETIIDGPDRGMRGGSFGYGDGTPTFTVYNLESTARYNFHLPTNAEIDHGFRVVEVPEPASLSTLALSACALLFRRRRFH